MLLQASQRVTSALELWVKDIHHIRNRLGSCNKVAFCVGLILCNNAKINQASKAAVFCFIQKVDRLRKTYVFDGSKVNSSTHILLDFCLTNSGPSQFGIAINHL